MVKERKHLYLKKFRIAIVLFAVFLAVFSSCTVRKSIQAHLDFPVAKPLNVSKSTLAGNYSCLHLSEVISSSENNPTLFSITPVSFSKNVLFSPRRKEAKVILKNDGLFLSARPLLYILYNRMKIL